MPRKPFQVPRRPAVRPHSEPIERDDDAIVDVGAAVPRETGFVTQFLAELATTDGLDDFPSYFDDTGPVKPGRDALDAPVRLHTRKL